MLITKTEKEGFAVESNGGVTVALSTGLTPELIAEGFARETVNKIQNLRKQANFEVTDRIAVAINAAEALRRALPQHEKFILTETLADRLEYVDSAPSADGGLTQECDINGERATIRVRRV